MLLSGCVTVAPAGSQAPSVTATPGAAFPSPTAPASSITVTEVPPSALATPVVPSATPTEALPTAVPVTPAPTRTARPSRSPRPTTDATPTPTPIAIDLSIFVNTPDLPIEWHVNTTYTIPIHVAIAASDVPNARAKVSVPEEAFVVTFETGPIAASDNYSHNVDVNLPAMGPATFTMSVKPPAGYVDYDTSNNKVTIAIQVLP